MKVQALRTRRTDNEELLFVGEIKIEYLYEKILVIHGPNLNLLGEREPGVYGTDTFESINNEIIEHAMKYEFHCDVYQSNHEGEIIDKLHLARKNYDGVISAQALITYTIAMLSETPSPQ